jgi:hypothetical protein
MKLHAKILNFETDHIQMAMLDAILRIEGYCVISAATLREATSRIENDTFDLVLICCQPRSKSESLFGFFFGIAAPFNSCKSDFLSGCIRRCPFRYEYVYSEAL